MKILIAYDGSVFANAILDDLRYAGLPQCAEVVVLTVAEPEDFLLGKKTEGVVVWLSCRLIEARMSARLARDCIQTNFPGWDVTFEARLAAPPQEIIGKVTRWNPDLVIIGQHWRAGSKRAGLGRVAKRVFKETNCSVRIARAHTRSHEAPPRIVIPLAASLTPEATARAVASRFWPPGTEIKLVASPGAMLSEMQLACEAIDARVEADVEVRWPAKRKPRSGNLLVTSEVIAGSLAPGVIETARRWRADCIFIGAEEAPFFERLICGNLVSKVAARAECSVEVVRGPIRRAPAIPEFAAGAWHEDLLPVAS
jgi:nucleotide-binding universal stress UspA family protein